MHHVKLPSATLSLRARCSSCRVAVSNTAHPRPFWHIVIIASAQALAPGQVSGSRARLPRHHFGAGSRARARCAARPRTSPHRSSLTHSTQAVGRQDQGAVCRGFGYPAQVRHSGVFTSSPAASRIRALCSGTHPGRLQDGAADGTSAGASTLDLPGKLQAQCGASSPPHNLSCTQAIAVVRPFAVRSRHR